MTKQKKLRHSEYYDLQPVFDRLYTKSQQDKIFTKLMDIISSEENIRLAYRNIKRNGGSNTAGTDKQTIRDVVPVALSQYLADHPEIRTLRLHLDNDSVGRGAVAGIVGGLRDRYEVWDEPPRCGKDVNDQLKIRVGLKRKEDFCR